ncbi:hypothetical protein U9M48_005903 [Paspalum notatum var. saurae]|uniref:Ubiquitin-like domain-containing protein n=1 Tax=Paspalum notatum var. saurae TaxID=547442 RepID=A0AAQ3PRY2_PASNO
MSTLEDKCRQLPRLQPKQFQIFVKLHTGQTITLCVEDHDTIATVKRKINDRVGLQPSEPYRLMYGGKYDLPDSSTIADCNIGKESTIHLILMSRHYLQFSITP